ncbi:hypothetical protein H072_2656 [Dactylellina haptotyla CBS 200.50]|uniref:Uncharacterized protein n=1 Tax=Dactylellina haptotyla (strain CBS 200.50) TaxID=1284197 RepID=S8C6P0_DACHA|nr:hypothetical protein H072_2656 [Dactylellina haptotyla CBS 200.50]
MRNIPSNASIWSLVFLVSISTSQDALGRPRTWPFTVFVKPTDPLERKIIDNDHEYMVCQFYTFDQRRPNVEICDGDALTTTNLEYFNPSTYQLEERNLPAASIFWTWDVREFRGNWWPAMEPFFYHSILAYVAVPVLDYLKRSEKNKPNKRAAIRMTDRIEEAGVFAVTPPYPISAAEEGDKLMSLEMWFEMDREVTDPNYGTPSFAKENYPDTDFYACKKESDASRTFLYIGNPIASLVADRQFKELAGTAEPISMYDNRAFEESSFFMSLYDTSETELELDFRKYHGMSCQSVKLIRNYLPWNASGVDIDGSIESTELYSHFEQQMTKRLKPGSQPPIGKRGELVVNANTISRLKNIGFKTWMGLFRRGKTTRKAEETSPGLEANTQRLQI